MRGISPKSVVTQQIMLVHLIKVFSPNKQGVVRKWCQWGKWTWYACSSEMWMYHCKLTRKQVRVAEQKLVEAGVVDVVVRSFDGTPIKHYHLYMDEALALLLKNSKWLKEQKGQSIMYGNNLGANAQYEEYLLSTSEAKTASQNQASHRNGMKTMGKIKGDTAQEVMANLNKNKSQIELPPKISCKPMADYWQRLLPLHVDRGFHKALTMKELGQITLFIKSVGTNHAAPAMEWAVREWAKMRYRAEEELGEHLPTTPTIAGLLRASSVAVNGYLGEVEQVQVKAPKVKSIIVQTTAPKGTKATSADIEKAWQELDHE